MIPHRKYQNNVKKQKQYIWPKLRTAAVRYKKKSGSILNGGREDYFLDLGGYAYQWASLVGLFGYYTPEIRTETYRQRAAAQRPKNLNILVPEPRSTNPRKVEKTLLEVYIKLVYIQNQTDLDNRTNLAGSDAQKELGPALGYIEPTTIAHTNSSYSWGLPRPKKVVLAEDRHATLGEFLDRDMRVNEKELVSLVYFKNKQNDGYSWTLYAGSYGHLKKKYKKNKIVTAVNPGKYGIFKKAARRSSRAFITWLSALFSLVLDKQNELLSRRSFDGTIKLKWDVLAMEHLIHLEIKNFNHLFLVGLDQVAKLIKPYKKSNILINIHNNWRQYNLRTKRSRYMKKFKRKSLYHSDRYKRRALIID